MRLGLERRRRFIRNEPSSKESKQTSHHQRVKSTAAIMTQVENVPTEEVDAVSLGSSDSLSSFDDPLLLGDIGVKKIRKEEHLTKVKGELEMTMYLESREMTLNQERWNAITILPSPIFCTYYVIAGKWISGKYAASAVIDPDFDPSQCMPHYPHALPPLPVIFIATAIIIHAPFSFLYHWVYANSLGPVARIAHWSRRLDHVFIHVASALVAYGTSGRWDYFFTNVMFNTDCIYRQFLKKVRPRRNQIRTGISILAYTIPILRRGDVLMFVKCWIIIAICGYLFASYPLKGWSHSAFHLVIALLPPLLLHVAVELPISQDQISFAVQCVAAKAHAEV